MFYHISPKKNRDSILRWGLLGELSQWHREWGPLVFLTKDYVSDFPPGSCDIWEVDVSGLTVWPGPDLSYPNEFVVTNVPPLR